MIKKIGFGMIGLLGSIAVAQAGMIVDIEGSNAAGERDFKDWGASVHRVHNLMDNAAPNNFAPGTGVSILSGKLTLNIWNDDEITEEDGAFDAITFKLGDGTQGTAPLNPLWDELVFISNLGDIAIGTINLQGGIDFKISGMGDYWVGESKLELNTDEPYASVPEPGVLMLLGLGLVGLRVARPKAA